MITDKDGNKSEDTGSDTESVVTTQSPMAAPPGVRHPIVKEAKEEEEQSPMFKKGRTPIRESAETGQSEDATSVKTLAPLVKFDLNLDFLKAYLEEIHDAVNDHASSISTMQKDIKHKAYEKTMGQLFKKMSDALQKECGERPHQFRIDD